MPRIGAGHLRPLPLEAIPLNGHPDVDWHPYRTTHRHSYQVRSSELYSSSSWEKWSFRMA